MYSEDKVYPLSMVIHCLRLHVLSSQPPYNLLWMERINRLLKTRINRRHQPLGQVLQLLGHLGDNRRAHLARRVLLQPQVHKDERRHEQLVELLLGPDQRRQGRVHRHHQLVGRRRDVDGLLEVERRAVLGRLGALVDLHQERRALGDDGERAEDVAPPFGHGLAELGRGLVDRCEGADDGVGGGEGRAEEGEREEEGGELHCGGW